MISPRILAPLLMGLFLAATPFDRGVEAYRSGDMKAAAEAFSSAGDDPVASYDAGLAHLKEGDVDAAISAFEAATVRGKGKVRDAALLNLGLALALKGDGIAGAKQKDESREDRMKRLGQAATAYRAALAVFRRVPPPSPDADQGARAAKVRLLATLDELQKLGEEEKKEAEEKALSDPPALLLRMLGEEQERRRTAARLSTVERRHRRLPARDLRKAEYEARRLLEKLAARLTAPPPAPPTPGGSAPGGTGGTGTGPSGGPGPGSGSSGGAAHAPEVSETAKATAAAVTKATNAIGEAEARLDAVDVDAARDAQTDAVHALTEAALRMPAPLPAIVGKLVGDQSSLLERTKQAAPDFVADEEGEILPWLSSLARIPDPPPAKQGGPPTLSPEAARQIRTLAGEAAQASERAAKTLVSEKPKDSVPDQQVVLDKLTEIEKLLPKPPKPPAERLRELLEEEKAAKKSIEALPGRSEEARKQAEAPLAESQTSVGREAGKIAEELAASPGEREKQAVEKVRTAESEIHGSSEALRRDKVDAAGEATDRAVKAIEEALDILSGKKKDQGQQRQQQPKKRPGDQQKKDGQKKEGEQDARKLTPREARRLMEEMDRNRREEERKLLPGGGGPRVDKDW